MAYKLYMYMISNMGSSSSRAVACARVTVTGRGGCETYEGGGRETLQHTLADRKTPAHRANGLQAGGRAIWLREGSGREERY